MTCESEREFLESHGEAKHAATARLIDDLIDLCGMLPAGLCRCDAGRTCRPHEAIQRLVERAHGSGHPERAELVVERFVRRIARRP